MGEVYRARDTRLDREVAIKILPPNYSGDPDRLKRFEQEARATSALFVPLSIKKRRSTKSHELNTNQKLPTRARCDFWGKAA